MANINESKYEEMISALHIFATNVDLASSEMQSLAVVSASFLGEEDPAVSGIASHINTCRIKYAEACETARKIAYEMQNELDEQRNENQVWSSSE
jgi:hypothetical protein